MRPPTQPAPLPPGVSRIPAVAALQNSTADVRRNQSMTLGSNTVSEVEFSHQRTASQLRRAHTIGSAAFAADEDGYSQVISGQNVSPVPT